MSALLTDPIFGDQNGAFDPAPLNRLASFMRDGKWLDVRTEDGSLQRVRITELRVRVRSEDVVFRQEWLDDSERGFAYREIVVDSDAIWKAWPTKTPIEKVAPPLPAPEPVGDLPLLPSDDLGTCVLIASHVVAAETGVSIEDVRLCNRERGLLARQACMLIVSALVGERYSATKITACFGYRSPMPLVTAQQKLAASHAGTSLYAIDAIVKRCELKVAGVMGS